MSDKPSQTRGRPKKLQRDHVINVALESYWANGPTSVSVNEICKRAEVSKPGLYREFGSEDGLQQSVLHSYCDMALTPLYDELRVEQPFETCVASVTALFLSARAHFSSPRGCLLRDMIQSGDHLGGLAQEAIAERQEEARREYAAWITRAVARGDISGTIPRDIAATYVDLQFGNAMTLLKRNEPDETIASVMQLAFSVFR